MALKENFSASSRFDQPDLDHLRREQRRLQNSTHEWILYLARENKALMERITELEERIGKLEQPKTLR
jgi:hypothetical protein